MLLLILLIENPSLRVLHVVIKATSIHYAYKTMISNNLLAHVHKGASAITRGGGRSIFEIYIFPN